MMRLRRAVPVCLLAFLCSGPVSLAQEQTGESTPTSASTSTRQAIAELERQVELLAQQLIQVQAQLDALKQGQEAAARLTRREDLRRAAAAHAQQAIAGPESVDITTNFDSGTRMQAQLNPEISVAGDLWLVAGDHLHEEMQVRGIELAIQSYLDPFTRAHVVIGHHGGFRESTFGHQHDGGEDEHGHGSTEVEEAYVTWLHLPGNLNLTVGKKRQQFGVLNRWHQHALDQVDAPWVLQESFGHHGLTGIGISAEWVLPRLWADANELTVEITNGDNEHAFAGSDWEHPSFLARLKSYWDLTDSYLEVGLNSLHGSGDPDGNLDNGFQALDFTFNWNPAGRELYRDFTLRGMVLRSEREFASGNERAAWGGYLYAQFKLSRSWIAGARYDRFVDQWEEDHSQWGISPYLTFWQSEFVRLRAQYSYRNDDHLGTDRQFVLQATFAAGPHKHETY